MNLKDLQDKIDEPIIVPPAHYELLDEASIWDWFRRLFGSPANTPRRPRDAGGRTIRYGPDGSALPIPQDIFTRRRNLPWEQPGAPWGSSSGPAWRAPRGYRNPHTGGPGQYHPNDAGWFWTPNPDVEGGWRWERFDDPSKVPAQSFPQPTTPTGTPGHQLPGHGPNGLPIGPNGGEMPVNPDTGRPWTENPFTGEDYPVPPPWEVPAPPPTMRPDDSPYGSTEVPGSVDGELLLKPGHRPPDGPGPFGGNEGPLDGSAPPQSGPGRIAYGGGMRRPTRTLQGLRTMAGAAPKTGAASK